MGSRRSSAATRLGIVNPKTRFEEIVDDLAARDPDVEASQMMGRPSIKAGGKLIACLESRGTMAFKLPDEAEQEKALALEGSRVYEPADNGRKMGGLDRGAAGARRQVGRARRDRPATAEERLAQARRRRRSRPCRAAARVRA